MKGACVVLQSGGPTCVINASLYGVITNKNILINEYKLPIRKDN